jgi:hypothetical protein
MSVGYQGHLGLCQETSLGEEASPPAAFAEIKSESLDMNNNLLRPPVVNGSRLIKRTLAGPVEAGGGIVMSLTPEGASPWLLKGLFGNVASGQAAEGVYDHTFAPSGGPSLPSFTVQVDHDAGCLNWIGCTVSSASLSITPDDLLDAAFDLVAQRPKATEAASPAYSAAAPWDANGIEIAFNEAERIDFESINLTIGNNVTPVRTLNGKRWAGRHVPGLLEVRGSVVFEFSSDAEMRRMWGGVNADTPQRTLLPGGMALTVTHTSEIAEGYFYTMTLNLPEIYYAAAPANITSAPDRIIQTVSFYASHNAQSDKTIELILRNGVSGYPNP